MNLSRAKMKVVVLRKEIRLLVFVLTDIKEKLVKVCYDTLIFIKSSCYPELN